MPFQPFTRSEVRWMFELSEGIGGGHAGERHVDISNDDLWERIGEGRNGKLAAFTAFLKFDDQIDAALELLNDPRHDRALEDFRVHKRPGKPYTILRHQLIQPIQMRYAIGGGAQTFPCDLVRLVIDKNHDRPRGMHIVTFMGEMGEMV